MDIGTWKLIADKEEYVTLTHVKAHQLADMHDAYSFYNKVKDYAHNVSKNMDRLADMLLSNTKIIGDLARETTKLGEKIDATQSNKGRGSKHSAQKKS